MLVFGIDETLDPARFALLPVRAREIMPGLLVSGSASAAPASRPCWSRSGLLASWSRGVGPLLATVVAIPIGVATCFLLSRAGTAAFAAVLSSRRFRDFAFVGLAGLGLVFGVGANLVGGLLGQGVDRFRTLLSDAATLASWTPFGWAWAVPADVASGRWLLAGLRLLLAVAFVVLLWLVWGHYLGKRLTEPLEAARGAGRMRGGDWVDRLYPATPGRRGGCADAALLASRPSLRGGDRGLPDRSGDLDGGAAGEPGRAAA